MNHWRPIACGVLASVCVLAVVADGGTPNEGFLVTFRMDAEEVSFETVAEIRNFVSGRHAPRSSDWEVRLIGPGGEVLWRGPIMNPGLLTPHHGASGGVPIIAKAPRIAGLSRICVHDAAGSERTCVPVDEVFLERAALERERFLEKIESNRRRVTTRERKSLSIEVQEPGSVGPAFDRLPAVVREHLAGEMAEDVEKTLIFGHDAFNVASTTNMPIAEANRLFDRSDLARSPDAFPKSIAKAAYSLSGVVRDTETSAPVGGARVQFWQYDTNGAYQGYLGLVTSEPDGSYSMAVDVGTVGVRLYDVSGANYTGVFEYVSIGGSTSYDVPAIPAVLITGTVTNTSSEPVQGVSVIGASLNWSGSRVTNSSGAYSLPVPRGWVVDLRASAPVPYMTPAQVNGVTYEADATVDWVLERGWVVSGTVRNGSGSPIQGATVLLRHVAPATAESFRMSDTTDSSGSFEIVARSDVSPRDYALFVSATGYVRHFEGLTVTGDVSMTVTLETGLNVSGVVTDEGGTPLRSVMVRAYRDSELVTSARTEADGSYSFNLAQELYDFEVVPWTVYGSFSVSSQPYLAQVETAVYVSSAMVRDYVLTQGAGAVEFILEVSDYGTVGSTSSSRFEVMQSGQTIASYYGGQLQSDAGRIVIRYFLTLDSGTYDIAFSSIGYERIVFANISVAGTPTVSFTLPERHVWQGVLRSAGGAPIAGQYIYSYDDLTRRVLSRVSATDGSFEVPIMDGGFIKFLSPELGQSILHTERLGNVTGNRVEDVTFDDFPTFVDSGGVVSFLYGDESSEDRYTIAMLGDGYTDIFETFTDVNGNGVWDGVLLLDLNNNGLYDSGETYTLYGEASAPALGTDPTVGNEPFSDLNGDGFPNEDDQAVLDANAQAIVRSLFGQDFWNANRNLVNIFLMRAVSNQAGYDVYDASKTMILERDTLFDGSLWLERNTLSADYTTATQFVQQYVPQAETIILMLNQPVRRGRDNSFITSKAGPKAELANSYVIAHEMGHNVGGLEDEYVEYSDTYEGSESSRFENVTTVTDPALCPWVDLIDPSMPIPSVPYTPGVGLFEGGYYRPGGVYRPADLCMMVSGPRYCPVCERQLQQRIASIRRELPGVPTGLAPRGVITETAPEFRWTSVAGARNYELELERTLVEEPTISLDVFDTSCFLFDPVEPYAKYKWRVRAAADGVVGEWSGWYPFTVHNIDTLTIVGPVTVNDSSTATYSAIATWSDGATTDVTSMATWNEDSDYAQFIDDGVLQASNVSANEEVTLSASVLWWIDRVSTTLPITIFNTTPTLTGLTITGPTSVNEQSTANYTATASWDNGTTSDVTAEATWSENSAYATISAGLLTTLDVEQDEVVTLSSTFGFGGVVKEAEIAVTIVFVPFGAEIFSDGFESGDRLAWSSAVGGV